MDQKAQWPGWETVRLIGRGSFGTVYEIQRDVLGDVEQAALKVISIPQNASDIDDMYSDGYDDESITSTFQSHLKSIISEYSLMKKMNGCVNVVHCDDVRYVQHEDGIGWDIFIKMELLTPLTKVLPNDIPEDAVIKVGMDICSALEVCRQFGVVHRDIKPQNIFKSAYGDYKLGDFGIAKTVEKTMGGTKIGTYKYMAPEVYNNQPYGSGADIYSLGLVLYWMLNERRMPFMPLPPTKLSAGMDETARHRRFSGEQIPEPLHGSTRLKQIVLKACAYDPKDRYPSAAAMLADLSSLSGAPIVIPPPVHVPDPPKPEPPKPEPPKPEPPKPEPPKPEPPKPEPPKPEPPKPEPPKPEPPKPEPPKPEPPKPEPPKPEPPKPEPPKPEPPTPEPPKGEDNDQKKKKPVLIGVIGALIALVIIILLLMRGCEPASPAVTDPTGTGTPEGTTEAAETTEATEETYLPELNTDRLALFQDGTAVLTLSGVPEDARIKWKSEDKSVAKVSDEGEVTAVGEGTTTITATWKHKGQTYEVSAEVTVTASGVTLNEYTISNFYIGETRTLTATTSPEGEKVEWKSSDESVIKVSADGVVTAVGSGTASVTVTFGTYTETCNVTVTKPSVTLSKTKSNLYAGDSTTVTVKTDPEGATVTWSSDDSGVATVSNGKIQAVSAGTTTVRAKITHAGKTYEETCTVSVISPSVSVSNGSVSLLPGESKSLSVSTKPEGLSVSWSSSNTSVATVSGGKITAVAPGSATITAQVSYGGKTYRTTCSVNVTTPSVSLSSSSLSLSPGETKTLSASSNAGGSISWSSSNTSVATVSGGKVTAVAPGSATITAQITVAGKTYKASCSVTVKEPTISVTSSASTITYSPRDKDTCTLTAAVDPDGGSVTWSTSDSSVATVSGSGTTATVTAVSSGSVTITATYSISGREVSDSCTISVEKAASKARLDNFNYATYTTVDGFWCTGTMSSNYEIVRMECYGSATSNALGISVSDTADTFYFPDNTFTYDVANLSPYFIEQYRSLYELYADLAGLLGADNSVTMNVTFTAYDSSGYSESRTMTVVVYE